MTRALLAAALTALLVLLLWLPAAGPASHFHALAAAEHAALSSFWSRAAADDAMTLALDLMPADRQRVPPRPASPHASAIEDQMSVVLDRLFHNNYMQSLQALTLLAAWRASALLMWLPWLSVFAAVFAIDGQVRRWVRAREFGRHDPELFALHGVLVLGGLLAIALSCLLPWTLPPWLPPVALTAVLTSAGAAASSFHRRA